MANHPSKFRLLCAGALLLAACTTKPQEKANPLAGSVKIGLASKGTHANASTTAPDICATFTLTPYALSSAGGQTLAGSPVVVQPTGPSATPILGCVHTPGVSPDWRYVVTASNFTGCSAPIAGISPAVETFTVDVSCEPGKDVSATVTANVSVPVANAGGYIDIGVSVNATEVQIGCKQADIDTKGLLHFGQSSIQPIGSPIPSAYTGIGIYQSPTSTAAGAAPALGTVQQFESLVHDAVNTDASFTGLLALPPAPQSATLVQAFTQPCPNGQMTVQPGAAECITKANLGFAGPKSTAQSAVTTAQIADVFQQWPGRGAVSASINGAQTIQLYTSLTGPHLSTLTPPVLGNDALTHTQTLSVAPANAIGLYGSLVHSDELLAVVQDPVKGAALVVLTLDETTGNWSAAAPIALSSFTTAQQTQMGLFGTGGCFPEPAVACAPVVAVVKTPVIQPKRVPAPGALTSSASGSLSASFTHLNGSVMDAAHPLVTSYTSTGTDGAIIHLQWSVTGLAPGEFAYAAMTHCDVFGSFTDTNGGTAIEIDPACTDRNSNLQAKNSYAFDGVQADASGGVSQNLQFIIRPGNFFTPATQTTWTIPFHLFVGSALTPSAGDLEVPVVGASESVLPIREPHDPLIAMTLRSAHLAQPGVALQDGSSTTVPGILWSFRYLLGTTPGTDTYTNNYLEGHSDYQLYPPQFSDVSLSPKLVLNSMSVFSSGGFTAYPNAVAAHQINANFTFDPATLSGSVDNLIGYSTIDGPQVDATYFTPLPTAQPTILSAKGQTVWHSATGDQTFTGAGLGTIPGSGRDVSPVPLAQLDDYIGVTCGDSGFSFRAGQHPECYWMYNFQTNYVFEALRSQQVTTLFNPTYVIKLSLDEEITTTHSPAAGVPAGTVVSTSDDDACDNLNSDGLGAVVWTATTATPARADWRPVRCLAYRYDGITTTPVISAGMFRSNLKASVTAGAAVDATHTTSVTYWATADNVIPDPATGNTWGVSVGPVQWKNSTLIDLNNFTSGSVGVDVDLPHNFNIHASGIPLPDLTIRYTLAPGGAWAITPSSTPESWFNPYVWQDVNGGPSTVSCDPLGATPRVLTCTITSVSGLPLATPGSGVNRSFIQPTVHYKYLPSLVYNNQLAYHTIEASSSAPWLLDDNGNKVWFIGGAAYDLIIGPNQLVIDKSVQGGASSTAPGAYVGFDVTFGAGGLNSGALGAGGVAAYDFFGLDYQPGPNGTDGPMVAQAAGCVKPVAQTVQIIGATGGTATPADPTIYYTVDPTPDITASTIWVAMPQGNIPAGATGLKFVPNSSQGQSGVLIPIDGDFTMRVYLGSPAGSTGKLCNSAVLKANQFITSGTPEAVVTLKDPCVDPFPWPVAKTKK